MIGSRKHRSLAMTALAVVAALLCIAPLASADIGGAIEAGRRALETLQAENADLPAVKLVERRAKAIEDARTLTVSKLSAIAESASAKRKSPFLYTAPSPEQLLNQVQGLFYDSAVRWDGLGDEQIRNLTSYLSAVLMGADTAVIDTYKRTTAEELDEEGRSKAKNYLVAYVGGAHDGDSYKSVLRLLAKELPGDVSPSVLVERTVEALGSPKAAWQAFEAADNANRWDEDERLRLLTLLVETAKDSREYEVAADAYRTLAKQDGKAGEDAQIALIRMLADNAENFESAIAECGTYLSRFAAEPRAAEVEFLKSLYRYKAQQYDAALADAEAFRNRYPDSAYVPNSIMVQGLATLAMRDELKALSFFDEVVKQYPRHPLCGKAEYLTGIVNLTSQRYDEAREAFQRVVDFYPEDAYVKNAEKYLRMLQRQPSQRQ